MFNKCNLPIFSSWPRPELIINQIDIRDSSGGRYNFRNPLWNKIKYNIQNGIIPGHYIFLVLIKPFPSSGLTRKIKQVLIKFVELTNQT